jgi:hypothetical protein
MVRRVNTGLATAGGGTGPQGPIGPQGPQGTPGTGGGDLAVTLALGNDTGGIGIINDTTIVTGNADVSATATAAGRDSADSTHKSVTDIGHATASLLAIAPNGDADANVTASVAIGSSGAAASRIGVSAGGGVQASIILYADNNGPASISIYDGSSFGGAGQFFGNTTNGAGWFHPIVRIAAGVPAGAPTYAELPIAVDTTAVTGGIYAWNGAVWIKASSI